MNVPALAVVDEEKSMAVPHDMDIGDPSREEDADRGTGYCSLMGKKPIKFNENSVNNEKEEQLCPRLLYPPGYTTEQLPGNLAEQLKDGISLKAMLKQYFASGSDHAGLGTGRDKSQETGHVDNGNKVLATSGQPRTDDKDVSSTGSGIVHQSGEQRGLRKAKQSRKGSIPKKYSKSKPSPVKKGNVDDGVIRKIKTTSNDRKKLFEVEVKYVEEWMKNDGYINGVRHRVEFKPQDESRRNEANIHGTGSLDRPPDSPADLENDMVPLVAEPALPVGHLAPVRPANQMYWGPYNEEPMNLSTKPLDLSMPKIQEEKTALYGQDADRMPSSSDVRFPEMNAMDVDNSGALIDSTYIKVETSSSFSEYRDDCDETASIATCDAHSEVDMEEANEIPRPESARNLPCLEDLDLVDSGTAGLSQVVGSPLIKQENVLSTPPQKLGQSMEKFRQLYQMYQCLGQVAFTQLCASMHYTPLDIILLLKMFTRYRPTKDVIVPNPSLTRPASVAIQPQGTSSLSQVPSFINAKEIHLQTGATMPIQPGQSAVPILDSLDTSHTSDNKPPALPDLNSLGAIDNEGDLFRDQFSTGQNILKKHLLKKRTGV